MGDRANVRIVDEGWGSDVYLYTHWSGSELPNIVRNAMARRERWSDCSYLARIVFSAMIVGQLDGATGFGISSVVGDGDDRIITLHVDTQTVRIQVPDGCRTFSFTEFASLKGDIRWRA